MTKSRTNADNVTADIAGITAGTGITGGGTSGTVTITNDMATTIAAKGDLLAGTANDAYSVLTVGSNGQVLTANSATATGLEFATPTSGGMTLISTTTLTGASVTLSSIPQTHKHLQLVIRNFKPATDTAELIARYNGDSGTRYKTRANASVINENFNQTELYFTEQNDNSVATGIAIVNIFDYTNTTTIKYAVTTTTTTHPTTTTNINYINYALFYNQTDAISSIFLSPNSGNFTSGTALLYGVS